jgi:hypothetical protein
MVECKKNPTMSLEVLSLAANRRSFSQRTRTLRPPSLDSRPYRRAKRAERAKLATETVASGALAELQVWAAAPGSEVRLELEEWAGQEESVEWAVPAQQAAVEAPEQEALSLAGREGLEMELPEVLRSVALVEEVQRGPARPVAAVVRLRPAALAAVATK